MKILFANFPGDGHFNPLTSLAVHLKQQGHDVRWYTSQAYAGKLRQLQIPHYPFKNAMDLSGDLLEEVFPGRNKKSSQLGKLKFDIINAFILRAPEYYADIKALYKEFAFELLIADCAFTGIPFVKELMKIPVAAIGVLPLSETSKDLPPPGMGMTPAGSFVGKVRQSFLRKLARNVIFREPNRVLYAVLDQYKIPHHRESLFDMIIRKSDLLLQIGTPGFEYYRSDLGENIRFIGALLPYTGVKTQPRWYDQRLREYKKIILVTQGTVEKDITKILAPTLEAYKDTDTLVIATTGGSGTQQLRKSYPQKNLIIEDFIPFSDVMPYVTAYVTNGGYGGTMLDIMNRLPMVVAGVHEGKNEICARVGYFKLGINLRTERPTPRQIHAAVSRIIADDEYRHNVKDLANEFARFNPYDRCTRLIMRITKKQKLSSFDVLRNSFVIPFSN